MKNFLFQKMKVSNYDLLIKKASTLLLLFLFSIITLQAQRKMENLDRGLVAVHQSNGVYLSWRMHGNEWYNVVYNLYRDGAKLNSSPLDVSNFHDSTGTLTSSYTVATVVNGIEQVQSSSVQPLEQQYLEIPMVQRPDGYEVNDGTAADLDGDGEYEIIIKRLYNDWSVEETHFTYFEAYKMDGTLMWEINVGPNIMSSGGVEINIAAFDLDEDGKAEVFLRTSEGTIFADSTVIGDTDGDGKTNYRYSVLQAANMQYMNEGPEFLSLVDGETGVELDRVDFIPRINSDWWGDGYGHRANKFFFGAPYLDGKRPSLFTGRGIYSKTVMRTYDVVDKKLVQRWEFHTDQNPDYYGQGNHNYTIADVDQDGRDEIVWGGMTVDDDGSGLYSTKLGHGDALHVGDLDPFRKGTEIWRCLEESPMFGTVLYDGATGDVLIHDLLGRDCGRCCAANISDDIKGKALWGSTTIFSATTKESVEASPGASNFRIYWDGDLLEELLDHDWGADWAGAIIKPNKGIILSATGTKSNNWTKANPTLQADLFGDWREEVIWKTIDNSKIRIYTTVDHTPYRNYTLMHDHQYRQAICWQMCGYNQPPHVSYFLGEGEGITVPPPPTIINGRLVYNGTGTWDNTSSAWLKDDVGTVYSDGDHVHFDILNGEDVSVTLSETVSPSNLTVNSPGNYTLNAASGKLSGSMNLIKQGIGSFYFDGTHDYTGRTEVWAGNININGTLTNSPVWVNMFGELSASGQLGKGVVMRYGSIISIGAVDTIANLVIADSLHLEENAEIVFDLHSNKDNQNDTLKVNGNLNLSNGSIIRINPHLDNGETTLSAGSYVLAVVNGNINCDINNIDIAGILGTPASLNIQNDTLVLTIKEMRAATNVFWNGATSNIWDLVNTLNFFNNEVEVYFATGDSVTINDEAVSKSIEISENIVPSSLVANNDIDFSISGTGGISGNTSLIKNGAGVLSINNTNTFTGKIGINSGTLQVPKLPNSISENSPLGPVLSDPGLFVINGGILLVTSETLMDRPVFLGTNGGTINNTNKITWNSEISGGVLRKTGIGELILSYANTFRELIVQEGTVRLFNEEALPGKSVTFENGTLKCYNNSGTYSTSDYKLIVPEGKTGKMYLDGRCSYNNTLTGAGTLSIYIPFIRTDFNGNWSNFEGSIYVNSNGGDVTFRINNSYGYQNASISIGNQVYAEHTSDQTVKIGSLTGTGTMGDGTWEIGYRNEDFTFQGTFLSGNINKVGSGTMVLTGSSENNGSVNVLEGALLVKNTSGSATGTSRVFVKEEGALGGTGRIDGEIRIQSGGTLYAGQPGLTGTTFKAKNIKMYPGSSFYVCTDVVNYKSDKLRVYENFNANGQLIMNNTSSGDYQAGQSFQIVSCQNIEGFFESISPEMPGDSLVWDTSGFDTTGTIKIKLKEFKPDTTTINDLNNQAFNNLGIYPNPSDGYVVINAPFHSEDVVIELVTLNGDILHTSSYVTDSQIKLDLTGITAAMYIIRAYCDEKIYIGKFIRE